MGRLRTKGLKSIVHSVNFSSGKEPLLDGKIVNNNADIAEAVNRKIRTWKEARSNLISLYHTRIMK